VWRAVLDELGQVLTVENVNAWLATNRALDQDGEALCSAFESGVMHTFDDEGAGVA